MTKIELLNSIKLDFVKTQNNLKDLGTVQSILSNVGLSLTDYQLVEVFKKQNELDFKLSQLREQFDSVRSDLHKSIDTCNHNFIQIDFVTERCDKCGAIRLDDEIFYGDENI